MSVLKAIDELSDDQSGKILMLSDVVLEIINTGPNDRGSYVILLNFLDDIGLYCDELVRFHKLVRNKNDKLFIAFTKSCQNN